MNQREKVVNAINYYEQRIAERQKQEVVLEAARTAETEATAELVRVLHVVYGVRAAKGVILRGKRYAAVPGHGSDPHVLEVAEAEFEVLG